MKTLYWHDYETFGIDPKTDRPSQFAGVRTDENLEVIEEPLVLYCQPAKDYLPSPESVLITGITPQLCLEKGVSEQQFAAQIHHEFSRPDTCAVGYNSIRFDDEFTRFMLYRNLYDPYEREWKNGNSRWDIIDMLRLARALRPEGIHWPNYADGTPSFRLEDLSKANGISHANAHDALSDVMATIAMAKLLKRAQPKLYDYLYELRNKRKVAAMLPVDYQTVVVHTSSKYSSEHGKTALVMPLAHHPSNKNGVVVFDLKYDPKALLELSADEIKNRLFTPRRLLPEGQDPIPLKTIHLNRSPAIAPFSTFSVEAEERLNIDREQAEKHYQILQNNPQLEQKLAQVFAQSDGLVAPQDPEQQLYSGGFCSDHDKYQMQELRNLIPAQHDEYQPEFDEKRYDELYFRYRAKNFSAGMTDADTARWFQHCKNKLNELSDTHRTFMMFESELNEALATVEGDAKKVQLLAELRRYAQQLNDQLSSNSG
ncbi:MAG: exodeoxyribonuclease I [Pseudomonadales bacterium]|nr:exodeoxyribonuclease I [Pseudomonadales bacterium]